MAEAQPIDIAIQTNSEYQEVIKAQLQKIEARLHENRAHQQRLHDLLSALSNGGAHKIPAERKRSLNIFTDADNERPEENPDTISKAKMKDKMPLTYKVRKWTDPESKALANAIKQQNSNYLISQAKQRFLDSQRTQEDEEIHKKEIEAIKIVDPRQLEASIEHVNWDEIAHEHVPGRTPHECQIRWMNVDAPWISKQPWSPEEERRLKILAIQNHGHNWLLISQQLSQDCGTNRTPTHCFARYQRSLNVNMTKSKWTEEEDRILLEAVKLYGLKNWGQVANCLEGRTGQQCLHRYQKTLCPDLKKGKWEWEEDRRLQLAAAIYGPGRWSFIALHVPKRTDVQCRERWCNLLAPDISHSPWSDEEDRRLLEIVDRVGVGRWTDIAKQLGNRTDNQCWRRWKFLRKEDVEEYKRRIVSMKALEYTDEEGNIVTMAGTLHPTQGYAVGFGAAGGQRLPIQMDQQQQAQQQQSYFQASAQYQMQLMAQQLGITDYSKPEDYQRILQAMTEQGGAMQHAAQIIYGNVYRQQQQQQLAGAMATMGQTMNGMPQNMAVPGADGTTEPKKEEGGQILEDQAAALAAQQQQVAAAPGQLPDGQMAAMQGMLPGMPQMMIGAAGPVGLPPSLKTPEVGVPTGMPAGMPNVMPTDVPAGITQTAPSEPVAPKTE